MVDQVPLLPYNVYMTEPPHLPVRQPDDEGGSDFVVQATLQEVRERGVVLEGKTRAGEAVLITLILVSEAIARVLLETNDNDVRRVRLARDFPNDESNVAVEQSATHIHLHTSLLTLEIMLNPFHLAFYGADGRQLLSQNYTDITAVRLKLTVLPFGFSKVNGTPVAFHETFTAEPDEHFFGFGEKFTNFDKRGQRITTWNADCGGAHSERSYKNVPFFLSSRGYGLFVDSTNAVTFDMAASNTGAFSLINPDTFLDYYVIAGPTPKEVITRYAELVSFPILPPKW